MAGADADSSDDGWGGDLLAEAEAAADPSDDGWGSDLLAEAGAAASTSSVSDAWEKVPPGLAAKFASSASSVSDAWELASVTTSVANAGGGWELCEEPERKPGLQQPWPEASPARRRLIQPVLQPKAGRVVVTVIDFYDNPILGYNTTSDGMIVEMIYQLCNLRVAGKDTFLLHFGRLVARKRHVGRSGCIR